MTTPTTYSTESRYRRVRQFVREALRESETDFTRGPIGRALGLLAIPMMLEMAMEAIFAVVDIAFVSRLGTEAVAAVGITEALITVLYAVAIGLSMSVTAMVSRRIGAGDRDGAARVTGQAIWLGAALSLVTGIAGVVFAEDLLRVMGASDGVVETGKGFTAVLLGGSASIVYLFMLNAAFRGAGDAPVALRSLMLANACNIALDPCLIFGLGPFPEMGVTGAAVATTIGRGVGVLYLAWYLSRPRGRLNFEFRHLALVPDMIRRMMRISAGGVAQFLIATSSWIVLMRIVAYFGSAPVAAYTIALRLAEFSFLPAWGLGNAAATLVGQCLGAGKPGRAERSAWRAVLFNVVFMTVLGVGYVLAAPVVVGWFTDEPEVRRFGIACLQIMGVGYPMYAVGMIIIQALNGAGATGTPSVLNFICFWLIQIPLAWLLATGWNGFDSYGPNGVFISIVVSETLLSLMAVFVFRRGAWKHAKV